MNKSTMTRKEANLQILEYVKQLIERYPDQRFGQIISNYVLPEYRERDIFFEESAETLNTVKCLFQ